MKFLAVANHAFKEAMRKKILLILGLFFIILIVLSRSMEVVHASDRSILVARVAFAAMTFFGVLTAVFISATSLPKEIEKKQIMTVMTKPINRWQFILGKNLGLIAASGLFLLLMSALSLVSIHLAGQGQDLTAKRSFTAAKMYVQTEEEIHPEEDDHSDCSHKHGQSQNKEGVQWFKSTKDSALWSWSGLKAGNLNGNAEITLRVMNITARGGARKTDVMLYTPCAHTKNSKAIGPLTVEDDVPTRFTVDPAWLDKNGALNMELKIPSEDYALGVKTGSIKILAPAGNFDFNFFKAVLLLFFEIILVTVVTVTGTTFLSIPVSICLGFFTLLAGHMINFLREVVLTITALGSMSAPHAHGAIEAQESNFLTDLFKIFMDWFTRLFPNLQRFELSSSVIDQINIPVYTLGTELVYLAIYIIILYVISGVILRFREFK